MKNIKNLPIGETFEYEGVKYEVLHGYCCGECAFSRGNCSAIRDNGLRPNCQEYFRQDGESVIFKKVERKKFKIYDQDAFTILTESYAKLHSDENKEIRIVRTFNDLDGLENGKGLIISCDDNFFIVKYKPTKDIIRKLIASDCHLPILKAMGFEFQYKPLRTKEEILNELVEVPFVFGRANHTLVQEADGQWNFMTFSEHKSHNTKYYTEKSIIKVARELNELIGDAK